MWKIAFGTIVIWSVITIAILFVGEALELRRRGPPSCCLPCLAFSRGRITDTALSTDSRATLN
jgi:hypothetical protein